MSRSSHSSRALPLVLGSALVSGSALLSGCAFAPSKPSLAHYRFQPDVYTIFEPKRQARPALGLDDARVEGALEAHRARVREEVEWLEGEGQAIASYAPRLSLGDVRTRVDLAHALGQREHAARWIAAHPRMRRWQEAPDLVEVEATFVRSQGAGELELRVRRRPGVEGPIAVAFPPGTYAISDNLPRSAGAAFAAVPSRGIPTLARELPQAKSLEEARLLALLLAIDADRRGERWVDPESERRWGHWPRAQDLTFLEAPSVQLSAHELESRVRVPVACADFAVPAPEPGRRYHLRCFEAGTPVDRLAVELCRRRVGAQRGRRLDPREAQLAVWLAREDLDWATFKRLRGDRGQVATFQDGRAVLPEHAHGAALLLLDAGIDPRPLRFYEPIRLAPARPVEPTPEPDPRVPPLESPPLTPPPPALEAGAEVACLRGP